MRAPDEPKPFDDSRLLRDGWQRTHEHPYVNADGILLFEKLRYERPDLDAPKGYEKRLLFRHRIGTNWYWGIGDRGERPLYHLQDIISAEPDQPVYVVESEKIVEKLAALNRIATCTATGWGNAEVEPLRGHPLILLVDNDVDGKGEQNAAAALNVLEHIAASIRVVRGGPLGGNLADRIDDEITVEEFDALVGSVKAREPEPQELPPPLVFVNLSKWIDVPVPRREWCVLNRIPARNVTAYAGHGGTGKTITAMQLAAATVLGKDWLGSVPEPGPFFYFSTEDDELEMHRRFARIAEYYGASISDLLNGGLHLLDHVGKDSVLGCVGRNGIQPTPLLDQLHEAASDIKPRTVVIDSLADVFAGKENDRAQTRQFVTLLRSIAISANTAIVLIGHPSLSGLASGSGMSGSTDWHNAPRGRMYLEAATTEQGEEPDKDLRFLKVMKQNYGPQGEIVNVRWQDGVFVRIAAMGTFDKLAADQHAEDLFLKLLAQLTEQGRNVSHAPTANNYAPNLFAKHPDGKGQKKEFAAAMERLFNARKIRVEEYDRRGSKRIERCEPIMKDPSYEQPRSGEEK